MLFSLYDKASEVSTHRQEKTRWLPTVFLQFFYQLCVSQNFETGLAVDCHSPLIFRFRFQADPGYLSFIAFLYKGKKARAKAFPPVCRLDVNILDPGPPASVE